jgi:sialate O-acetylesterase
MEMPLVAVSGAYTGIQDAQQEVAAANFPDIRLFQVGNFSSKEPLLDVESGGEMYGIPPAACQWRPCSSDSIPHFAATAYFFARHLHQQLNVPIGIIDAAWGGTPAEAWTPAAGLEQLGYTAELQQTESRDQTAQAVIPTRLYNGMIHPLGDFKIRGVIWYQGEGNAGQAARYKDLFSTMIQSWRERFGEQLPFYFAQIAPFNYNGVNAAFLREAQLQTLAVPKTGMAVTLDIGNLTDIHPKNKQEVGRRLALWALARDYGREIPCSGPVFRQATFDGAAVQVAFDSADGGLATIDNQPPSNFTLAGEDQVFHPAAATIAGNVVILSAAAVPEPKAARYAFTSDAQPNLINQAGLPASSFRTDAW